MTRRDGRVGRRRSPGKRVCGKTASRVRIPLSPPFCLKFGRARRGGSGALNLQPARAGFNSCPRPWPFRVCLRQVVTTPWSRATHFHEPRQVRKEAAVSGSLRVPRGRWGRANYRSNAWEARSKAGARSLIIFPYNHRTSTASSTACSSGSAVTTFPSVMVPREGAKAFS